MFALKKNLVSKTVILCFAILLCSCANTATHREVVKQPRVETKDTVNSLVVKRALRDDVSSKMYKIQLMKEVSYTKFTRSDTKIVEKRYPFSVARKVDEFIIGAITVPFTPLAIVGGVINGDPDLAIYPVSMIWPFRNFRPEKAGLLSGPVTPEVTTNVIPGAWRREGTKRDVSIVRGGQLKIITNGKMADFHTTKDGIIIINLSKLPGVYDSNGSVDLRVTFNGQSVDHTISAQRLVVVRNNAQPDPSPQNDLPGNEIPDLTQDLSEKETVAQVKKPVEEKVAENTVDPTELNATPDNQVVPAKKPTELIPAPTNQYPGMDRALLYKGLTHGYWIKKQDGFPIMGVPNKPGVVAYTTENMQQPNGNVLAIMKEYYVFAFSFAKDNANVAVKVGTSPFENNAHGWINAKDLFLWNTLYRVRATKSFSIYRSHDDCLQGSNNVFTFEISQENVDTYFPVLEKKGSIWCIAYPDQNGHLQHGWVQWLSENGLEVEVRAMKHKIDMAINYLAKRIIINAEDLEKQYTMELRGPLYLLKPKEEMKMSSFKREKESSKITKARQIEAPADEAEFQEFHRQVQELGKILTEKEVWQTDDDVIYVPAERD